MSIAAAVEQLRDALRTVPKLKVKANLGEVLASYRTVLVPEMNLGQLVLLLRARYLVDAKSYTNVTGLPFKAEELQDLFLSYLDTGINAGVHA